VAAKTSSKHITGVLGSVGVLVEMFSVDLGKLKESGHRGASAWVPVSPP